MKPSHFVVDAVSDRNLLKPIKKTTAALDSRKVKVKVNVQNVNHLFVVLKIVVQLCGIEHEINNILKDAPNLT